MSTRAKQQQRERTLRWKKAHPEYKQRTREVRARRLAQVDQLKDHPCVDCNTKYPVYVMEWDHVRGEKLTNVARLRANNSPISRVLDEIAKCDLVCSNCHRIRTHTREDGNYAKTRVYSGRKPSLPQK